MDVRGKANHPSEQSVASPPRVLIYSENGSTGDDLEACLQGPFSVEVAAGLGEAVEALSLPAAALLVIPADDPDFMNDWSTLVHRAIIRNCRVMVLGATGGFLRDSFREAVSTFPDIPDPARLHHELNELIA